jgi:hypothetical protein
MAGFAFAAGRGGRSMRYGKSAALLGAVLVASVSSVAFAAPPPVTAMHIHTPLGMTNKLGQPVSADVTIQRNAEGFLVTITNTTPHIMGPEQCVSGITFHLSGHDSAHRGETHGYARTLYPGGYFTAAAADETHWVLSNTGSDFRLATPDKTMTIISAPDQNATAYGDDADALTKAPGLNPFLTASPTFQIDLPAPGLTDSQFGNLNVVFGTEGTAATDDNLSANSPTDAGTGRGDACFGGNGGISGTNSPISQQVAAADESDGPGGGGRTPFHFSAAPALQSNEKGQLAATFDGPLTRKPTEPVVSTPCSTGHQATFDGKPTGSTPVPEPMTAGFMVVGGMVMLARRRRRG